MSEEEMIKRKLLQRQQEAMQQQFAQHASQQVAYQQQLELLKALMNEILEPKARERLSNIRLVKPDVATQIQVYLAQAYQAGQIRKKITDQELVALLKKIDNKTEFKIQRK